MGVEVSAVTTIFPSDQETRRYLAAQGREEDWRPLAADGNAVYDIDEELDLSALEPLIALPSSPGNVVPVREVEGQEIYQAYIGSSANPGYRDAAVVAAMVAGRRIASGVSLDINPASRQALEQLIREGGLARLIEAGARLAASAWVRRPPLDGAACAPCRETFPGGRARRRIRSTSAVLRRLLPPHSLA